MRQGSVWALTFGIGGRLGFGAGGGERPTAEWSIDVAAGYHNLMKLILAIIQPAKLEAVKEALSKVEVFRMTIVDVQGFGRQKGHAEVYRGHELTVNLLRKVQLQIAVNEDFVEPTVNAIMEAGRTGPEGRIGDGKIFILPLEDCLRIRTGERGPEAI
jgi:nitrogen regulatory protein P-II 1